MTEQDDDAAPGWKAIEKALASVYSSPVHVHFAPTTPRNLGGSNDLDGISVYRQDAHWHYVGFGCTELYEKYPTTNPELSGWGFEFTFRLADSADEPPQWPLQMMQRLAAAVFQEQVDIRPGLLLKVGPLGWNPTRLEALLFIEDPQLGAIDTPHGKMCFLQMVGVTDAEVEGTRGGKTGELVDRLRSADPLLVTDLSRV
ncbi:suppressor of fused domain protein [bacterium CPR1]|nr:suppressor of fused domain protein [bacterium CPR1]